MKSRKIIIYISTFLFFVFLILLFTIQKDAHNHPRDGRELLVLSESIPEDIALIMRDTFSQHAPISIKDRWLKYFLDIGSVTLAYDIQAHALEEGGVKLYFYPLYDEIIAAIPLNDKYKDTQHTEILDLLYSNETIAVPTEDLSLKHVLFGLSLQDKEININAGVEFFSSLNKQGRLTEDLSKADIVIRGEPVRKAHTLSKEQAYLLSSENILYTVGILSKQALQEQTLDSIQKQLDAVFNNEIMLDNSESSFYASNDFYTQYMKVPQVQTLYRRHIVKSHTLLATNNVEYLSAGVFLILLIVFSMIITRKSIIHVGIKNGLITLGVLLSLWIFLSDLRAFAYPLPYIERAVWYLHFLVLLPIPVVSLYMAENVDTVEMKKLSWKVKTNAAVALVFLFFVLSNDIHQWVFKFHTDNLSLWRTNYSHGIIYYVILIWIFIMSAAALFLLLKKGRKSAVRFYYAFPTIIVFITSAYILLRNSQIVSIDKLSSVYITALLLSVFWLTAIASGLIPSNRAYRDLFEYSDIYMWITDNEGYVVHETEKASSYSSSASSSVDTQKNEGIKTWSIPIAGGNAIVMEDISMLNDLKNSLWKVTKALETENRMLENKEKVLGRLVLLQERNRLTSGINQIVEDSVSSIKQLIQQQKQQGGVSTVELGEINHLAVYCKRTCELFVKSKRNQHCPASELCRLINEMSRISARDYEVLCKLEKLLSMSEALLIYDIAHIIYRSAIQSDIPEMFVSITEEAGYIKIYMMASRHVENLYVELLNKYSTAGNITLSQKYLTDAYSLTIQVAGSEKEND